MIFAVGLGIVKGLGGGAGIARLAKPAVGNPF
jgi:hypothetical protein